ncbi:major capsid protein [Burkholderia pseudomallei]|jgi:hypothetical protein|uniref:major capsid protein n=2 Tax=Bacteria TaxID=2 RepID=UPI0024DF4B13|nr:major capsid protein [Burkholderia pseudomallei]
MRHSGDFQILDFTGLMEIIPRQDLLITGMNLFEDKFGNTTKAEVERVTESTDTIKARQRSGERNYASSEKAQLFNFNVPFFPLDKTYTAADIQNFRAYFSENAPKTVQSHVERILARIRRGHIKLKEKALFEAVMGNSYSPEDPRCQYDYYDVWGVDKQTCDIDFTAVTLDPTEVIEAEARAWIIDNANNNASGYQIIVLASRKWFSALIQHPLVVNAYQYYSSTQEPLRNRLGGDNNNRIFVHKNITFIEDISGNIPDGKAYIMPKGIEDMFTTHYAPADTLEHANQTAEEMYVFYKESSFLRMQKIESETSFIAVNNRPELVVESTGTF